MGVYFACVGRLLSRESLGVLREAWSARFYDWDAQCYKGKSTLQGTLASGATVFVDPHPLGEPGRDTEHWVVDVQSYGHTPADDVLAAEVGGPLAAAGCRWYGPRPLNEVCDWLDGAGDSGGPDV